MKRTWYIYEITNKVNGNNYIGQRYCPSGLDAETDIDYMGSGKLLGYAKRKYGIQNFSKRIILADIPSQKLASDAEIYYIWLAKSIGKAEYNIAKGGQGCSMPCSETKKKNISQALLKSDKHRKTHEQFIKEANLKHNNLYDYSLVNYKSARQYITIICKKHGEFVITPNKHLMGQGCQKCGIEKMANKKKKYTQESFINKLKEKFGNKFDYSKVKYIDLLHDIILSCDKHGEFSIRAGNILTRDCPKCRLEWSAMKRRKKRVD